MIPQIIVICWFGFKLGIQALAIKKDKKGFTDGSTTFAAAIIYYGAQAAVLYWGGFFDDLINK